MSLHLTNTEAGYRPLPAGIESPVQHVQPPSQAPAPATHERVAIWGRSHSTAFFDYTAATTAAFNLSSGIAVLEGILLDENVVVIECLGAPASTVARARSQEAAILEMRPARRSLRDKAREEMSEFERQYPW